MLGQAISISTLAKFNYENISHDEVFFLLYMIGKAYTTGNPFFYTDKKIIYETGLSYRQIKARRDNLVEYGYIRVTRKVKNITHYYVSAKEIARDIELIIKPEYQTRFLKQLDEFHKQLKEKRQRYEGYKYAPQKNQN
jgi:hypothetical protein